MATRTITFLIQGRDNLTAAVNSAKSALKSLSPAAQAAIARTNSNIAALKNSLAALQKVQSDFGKFRELKQTVAGNAQALQAAQQKANQLAREYRNAQTAAQNLAQRLTQLKNRQAELKTQRQAANMLFREAKSSGDTAKLAEARARVRALADEYKNVRAQIKQTNGELRGVNLSNRAFESAKNEAARLSALLQSQRQQLQSLRTNLSGQGFNTDHMIASQQRLQDAINRTTQALTREHDALNRLNQSAQHNQNFAAAQQDMANAYANFQNSIQTAETIMNPFTEATKTAMTFERQMSRVKAVTQMRDLRAGNLEKVNESMRQLTEQAERLGASTEFTSVEVAKGMEKFGYAGWTAEQIQAAMPSMVDLASISPGHNIERMADILSDTATAMGIKAGDTVKLANGKIVDAFQHQADSWAYATTTANLNDEDLFMALRYNAGAMKLAGLSEGDIFAANMVVANAGLKGSMAGTAFRSGIIRLQAPAKKGAQALEEMGFNASEAQKEMAAAGQAMKELGIEGGGVMDKIVTIKKRFDELGAAGQSDAQAALINDIFGKHAYQAWAEVLRSNNLDQLREIAEEINSGYVDGWSAETANVIRDNTATEVEYLKSAWDALAKSVGDAFLPAATAAAKALTNFVNTLNNFVQNNQTAVQWLGLLAGALSGIIVAGAGIAALSAAFSFVSGGIMAAVGAVRGLVTILSVARAAVMGFGVVSAAAAAIASAPIWLIVAAVVAIIAVVGYATGAFDGLGDAIANAFNHPQGAITGFCELAKSSIDSAVDYIMARWLTLKSALSHPIEAIINFVDHGDVVGGNVVNGTEQVKLLRRVANWSTGTPTKYEQPTISHSNGGGGGGSFGSVNVQSANIQAAQVEVPPIETPKIEAPTITAPKIEVPPVDTSAIQASFDAASFSSQSLSYSLMSASPAAQALAYSAQTAAASSNSLSFSAQTAAAGANALGFSSQAATGGISAMSASAAASTGNISSMAGASSSAAGSISGLGAAAASAIGSLLSAGANAAGAIFSVISSAGSAGASVAHNAEGGIYNRGSFLTTFAEKSPEAAIPIDSTARAKNLWVETGNLLGMFEGGGGSNSVTINLTMNFAGERPADTNWVDDVRATFAELAEQYFGEKRRVSYS